MYLKYEINVLFAANSFHLSFVLSYRKWIQYQKKFKIMQNPSIEHLDPIWISFAHKSQHYPEQCHNIEVFWVMLVLILVGTEFVCFSNSPIGCLKYNET